MVYSLLTVLSYTVSIFVHVTLHVNDTSRIFLMPDYRSMPIPAVFRIRHWVRIRHFRLKTYPNTDPGFLWPKSETKFTAGQKLIPVFFLSKIAIYLSLALHKWRPSYKRAYSVKRKHPAIQNMKITLKCQLKCTIHLSRLKYKYKNWWSLRRSIWRYRYWRSPVPWAGISCPSCCWRASSSSWHSPELSSSWAAAEFSLLWTKHNIGH